MKNLILASWLLCGAAQAAGYRELTFINKCNKRVLIAFSSHVANIGGDGVGRGGYWATEGWLPLDPGASHTARVSDSSNAAALAQLDDGTVLTGNEGTFCVSGSAFSTREYAKAGKSTYFVLGTDKSRDEGNTCADAGGHLRGGFQTLEFKDFKKFNFNLSCDNLPTK